VINFSNRVADKIKTHGYVKKFLFSFENHALFEIMWTNIVESDKSEMTIWRMRIARWIPKATTVHA